MAVTLLFWSVVCDRQVHVFPWQCDTSYHNVDSWMLFPPKAVTILQLWLLFCGSVTQILTHTVTDSLVRHKVTNDETSQIVICSGGSECHKSCIFVCVLIRIIETMTLNDAMHLCGISLMKSLSCHSHPKIWTLSSWSLFWVPYIQRSECCAYIFISHSGIIYIFLNHCTSFCWSWLKLTWFNFFLLQF